MKKVNIKHQTLQEALVDLYISIKPRKKDESPLIPDGKPNEYELLQKTDPKTIIQYIKSSIDVIVQMLADEKLLEYNKANDDPQEYENLLIKTEGDIRGHIRTEHQLKLHSELLEVELEEMEKQFEHLKRKHKKQKQKEKLQQQQQQNISCTSNSYNNNTNNSNTTYTNIQNDDLSSIFNNNNNRSEVSNLKMLLKSYEDQTLKLALNEKKLKAQLIQKEKELKHINDIYNEQIKQLNKKIFSLEERSRISNAIKVSSCQDDSLNKNTSTRRRMTSALKNYPNNNTNQKELTKKTTFQSIYLKGDNSNSKTVNKSHSFVIGKKEELSSFAKKHDELLAKLDKCSKKIIKESGIQNDKKKKGHNRHNSMQESLYIKNQKDKLFNSNLALHYHHKKNNSHSKLNGKIIKNTCNEFPTNNFVINQIGAPFVNNINIYTTNTNNNNNNDSHSNSCNKIYRKLNPEMFKRKSKQGSSCLNSHNS